MSAYATAAEYAARFGAPSDPARLDECLADASRLIDAVLASHGRDPSTVDPGALMQVCRSVASRTLGDGAVAPPGVTQYSMTASPYAESWTVANPNLDAYLTKSERTMLGLGRARMASVAAGWSS